MLIGIDASRAVSREPVGTEHYSIEVIRGLTALETEHRFRLYYNQPPLCFPEAPKAELRIMPFPRLWTHLRLSWEMMTRPPDVLFVPAHVLPIIHPRCSLVTVHDLGYLYYPEAHPPFQRWYLRWSTAYNAWAATHVIADSETTKQDLVQHCRTPAGKISVVYPGRDESLVPVENQTLIEAVKARYGLSRPYVLYLGTLQPRKNLVRLVEAWAKASVRGYQLVLAGKKGWLYENLFRRVRELGLENSVIFPGYVPRTDLAPLLSGAAAFILPSLYEGFGFPVLEAMSCGTPVICSNLSSLLEVAGDAALLVDPTDTEALAAALIRLLEDTRLRAELQERGFRQTRRFSWTTCAQQIMALLEMVTEPYLSRAK